MCNGSTHRVLELPVANGQDYSEAGMTKLHTGNTKTEKKIHCRGDSGIWQRSARGPYAVIQNIAQFVLERNSIIAKKFFIFQHLISTKTPGQMPGSHSTQSSSADSNTITTSASRTHAFLSTNNLLLVSPSASN